METGKNMVSRETQEETGAEEGVHTVMGNKAEPTTSGDNGERWQRATTGPPPVLVSKVLPEHNHNLSFTIPRLPSHYKGHTTCPQSLSIDYLILYRKSLATAA